MSKELIREPRSGFLLVDKPIGWTSSDLVQSFKKYLPKKTKIGHAGTLDPLATGLMIIGISRSATKQFNQLLKKEKTYLTEIDLSAYSETDDAEGPLDKLNLEGKDIPSVEEVESLIEEQFIGKIKQIPSKYSAIKINGKRSYELARYGKEVEVPEREVEIYHISVLDYKFPILVLEVKCSAGTYIRTLGRDIGTALGFRGYLQSLRRTKISNFDVTDAVTIEEIKKWQSIPKGMMRFH